MVTKYLFFILIAWPTALIVLGVGVRHKHRLPRKGPAILAVNHNSHLDTIVLMVLLGLRLLKRVRPAGASDYFFRTKLSSWLSLTLLDVIPLDRHVRGAHHDVLKPLDDALEAGEIVILFPEGSRGEPEELAELRPGIAHLVKRHPKTPVIPVFMRGLGKALPRGDWVPVPFNCDVFVGEGIEWRENKREFMERLEGRFEELSQEGHISDWE